MIDKSKIRTIDNFPSEGIKFFDITTILNDANQFQLFFNDLIIKAKQLNPEVIVALEARGFFFAPALALALKIPFAPIRKKGKLPFKTYTQSYTTEYSEEAIQIHQDAFPEHKKVLIFDDILATGGTAAAAVHLVKNFNPSSIHLLFLMELSFLHGRDKLSNLSVDSLLIE